jgi:hypothetical protein
VPQLGGVQDAQAALRHGGAAGWQNVPDQLPLGPGGDLDPKPKVFGFLIWILFGLKPTKLFGQIWIEILYTRVPSESSSWSMVWQWCVWCRIGLQGSSWPWASAVLTFRLQRQPDS